MTKKGTGFYIGDNANSFNVPEHNHLIDFSFDSLLDQACKVRNNGIVIFPFMEFLTQHFDPHQRLIMSEDGSFFDYRTFVWDDDGYIIEMNNSPDDGWISLLSIKFTDNFGDTISDPIYCLRRNKIRRITIQFTFEKGIWGNIRGKYFSDDIRENEQIIDSMNQKADEYMSDQKRRTNFINELYSRLLVIASSRR